MNVYKDLEIPFLSNIMPCIDLSRKKINEAYLILRVAY